MLIVIWKGKLANIGGDSIANVYDDSIANTGVDRITNPPIFMMMVGVEMPIYSFAIRNLWMVCVYMWLKVIYGV